MKKNSMKSQPNIALDLHLAEMLEENTYQGDTLKDICLTPRSFEEELKNNNFRNLLW